jgi:hypothetical protein
MEPDRKPTQYPLALPVDEDGETGSTPNCVVYLPQPEKLAQWLREAYTQNEKERLIAALGEGEGEERKT